MKGEKIDVLDKGFVYLVDRMGDDAAVCQAARVSYMNPGTKTPDEDRKLIKYLLNNDHGTPFEHAVFKWHVKCPILVMRQWIRHRMSSYNETSFRYREVPDEMYEPALWRGQDTKNRQGSSGELSNDAQEAARVEVLNANLESIERYKRLLGLGVSREMARMVVPVNVYTEFYWTVNARALLHFFGLRSESHAQWETRQYSDAMWQVFERVMPWTAEAFLAKINSGDPARYPGINSPENVERRVKAAA